MKNNIVSDANELESLVNNGEQLTNCKFLIDKDIYLNKPFYARNCTFEGEKTVYVNGDCDLKYNVIDANFHFKEPLKILTPSGQIVETNTLRPR